MKSTNFDTRRKVGVGNAKSGARGAKKARKAKASGGRNSSVREGIAANAATEKSAERVKAMTLAEQQARLKEIEKELAKTAPTLEVASSDLLAMLQLIGMLFVQRYYPDADYVNLSASKYPKGERTRGGRVHEYWVQIPIPTPGHAEKKGGA